LDGSFYLFLLISTFLLIDPMWRGINGFRFSLSSIVFVFIFLKCYKYGFSLLNIIFALSTIFIHFSMFFPVFIFIVFHLFSKRINFKVIFYAFIFSFFFTEINLDVLNNFLKNYIPEFLIGKVDDYLRESFNDELEEAAANTNWYAVFFLKGLFYSCSLMLFEIYFRSKELITYNKNFLYLLKFTLLLTSMVNVTKFMPSFGRMALISNMFILYIFIIMMTNFRKSTIQKFTQPIIISLLLLYVLVQMRIGFEYISIVTVIGNPIISFFISDNKALITLIK